MGVVLPGCAETFTSQRQEGKEQQEWQGERRQGDQHQKMHPIRRGDVAIPAGATHWLINEDEQEELVIVSINDLSHRSNQLDQRHRVIT